MNSDQTAMFLNDEKQPADKWLQFHAIIVDRGSKYSVTAGHIENATELNQFLKKLKSDKKYRKATHNTYAARYIENGKIIDVKSDDGETGAGMIVLRELQRSNTANIIVVVTRWFGGVMLHGDRLKHVQDATRKILGELTFSKK